MKLSIRIWSIAAGAAALALLAGGWFLGVQPQLTAAGTSDDAAANIEMQNQATQIKLAKLSRAAAKSDAMHAENDVLLKAVPSVLKPNTFIRRVEEVATLDGVQLDAVTPGDGTAYTSPPPSDPSSGLGLAKTSPLVSGKNLTVVPVTVSVGGDADSVVQFTHDIQNDERAFSVSSVQIATSGDSTGYTAILNGYIYVLKR